MISVRGPATVSDLSIATPNLSNGDTGLNLADAGATATRIAVSGGSSSTTGVRLAGGKLDHSTVTYGFQSSSRAVSSSSGSEVADDDLTAGAGIQVKAPGTTTRVLRTRIRSGGNGVTQICGRVDVDSSLVDLRGAVNYVAFFTSDDVCAQNVDNTFRLRHVTAIGNAQKSVGIFVSTGNGAVTRTVQVTDSIIAGFPNAVIRSTFGGVANVSLDHSAYDASTLKSTNSGGGSGALTESAPLGTNFGFVNAADADWHLISASPLIDAGRDPVAADESTTDLDGATRVADGNGDGIARSDVGAFELQPPAPPAPAPAPGGGEQPTGGSADAGTSDSGSVSSSDQAGAGSASGGTETLALTLAGRTRQRLGRKGRVVVIATADQPAQLDATGTARVGKGKTLALRAASARAAATTSTLTLTLPKRTLRKARAALARHKRVVATVTVTARTAAGQAATASRKIGLVR